MQSDWVLQISISLLEALFDPGPQVEEATKNEYANPKCQFGPIDNYPEDINRSAKHCSIVSNCRFLPESM
jgi:hypothetical protein